MKQRKGFTLLEFVIFLAILGILASIAIPSYCNYGGRTVTARALNHAKLVQTQIATYIKQQQHLPTRQEVAAFKLPKIDVIDTLTWYPQQTTLIVKLNKSSTNFLSGGMYFALTLKLQQGDKFEWLCSTQHPLLTDLATIPDSYLPPLCRQKT